jgi:hypothetical protein
MNATTTQGLHLLVNTKNECMQRHALKKTREENVLSSSKRYYFSLPTQNHAHTYPSPATQKHDIPHSSQSPTRSPRPYTTSHQNTKRFSFLLLPQLQFHSPSLPKQNTYPNTNTNTANPTPLVSTTTLTQPHPRMPQPRNSTASPERAADNKRTEVCEVGEQGTWDWEWGRLDGHGDSGW